METLEQIFADYEADVRGVADEFGGEVEVWRAEPAEVVEFPSPPREGRPEEFSSSRQDQEGPNHKSEGANPRVPDDHDLQFEFEDIVFDDE